VTRIKVGTRIGWSLSDGGQDNGRYEVVEVNGTALIIENQHGNRFHAETSQCWELDE